MTNEKDDVFERLKNATYEDWKRRHPELDEMITKKRKSPFWKMIVQDDRRQETSKKNNSVIKIVCARCGKPMGTITCGHAFPCLIPSSYYTHTFCKIYDESLDNEGIEIYCPDCYLEGNI